MQCIAHTAVSQSSCLTWDVVFNTGYSAEQVLFSISGRAEYIHQSDVRAEAFLFSVSGVLASRSWLMSAEFLGGRSRPLSRLELLWVSACENRTGGCDRAFTSPETQYTVSDGHVGHSFWRHGRVVRAQDLEKVVKLSLTHSSSLN